MSAFTSTGPSSLYPSLSNPYTDHLREGSARNWTSSVLPGTPCYPYDTTGLYNPYSDTRYSGMDSAARRKNATRETTNTLKAWLYEHRKNPYPTKGEKIMLAIITKMTLTQVSTWFANARRRLKKENKMTWEPRNKTSDNNSHDMDDDDRASIDGDRDGAHDDLSSSTTSHSVHLRTTMNGGHSSSSMTTPIHNDDHRSTSPPRNHHHSGGTSNNHNQHNHHDTSRRSPILDVECESINDGPDGKRLLLPLKGASNLSDVRPVHTDHTKLTDLHPGYHHGSINHHHHHSNVDPRYYPTYQSIPPPPHLPRYSLPQSPHSHPPHSHCDSPANYNPFLFSSPSESREGHPHPSVILNHDPHSRTNFPISQSLSLSLLYSNHLVE